MSIYVYVYVIRNWERFETGPITVSLKNIYTVSTNQILVCPPLLIIYIDWVVRSGCLQWSFN